MKPYKETRFKNCLLRDFFKVREDLLEKDGKVHAYDVVEIKGNAVSVIVETASGKMLLLKEWRHAVGGFIFCTIGGLIHRGEDPLDAAKRELLEETGYSSEKFTLLGTHHPFPGMTGQQLFVVLAQEAKRVEGSHTELEPLEVIETQEIPLEALLSLLREGEGAHPVDGILLSSLFYYQLRGVNEDTDEK